MYLRMIGTVKRWGNSYALRLTKGDLDRLHLRLGDRVKVAVEPLPPAIDVSRLPVFTAGATLAEARQSYADERVRRWQPEGR